MTPNSIRPRERFDADPSDRAAFELLEEQLFLAAQWSELVALYDAHLGATRGARLPAEEARLLFRMGQALEQGPGDADLAAGVYRTALELDPDFVPALRSLRSLCVASGAIAEALPLAEREATLAPGGDAENGLAELAERALAAGDAQLASTCFERALALRADDERALLGLPCSLEASGRLNEAVGAWQCAATKLGGAQRSAAIRALGALLVGPLQEDEHALQHFQQAHDQEPGVAEWIESLFAVLMKLERFEAAAALAPRRIELAPDAKRRGAIAMETGRLQLDHLAAPAKARGWFEHAAEWCDDGTPQLALAELASRSDDPLGQSYYLERAMELGAEIPAWSDLGLGETLEGSASLDALRSAANERPGDVDAQESLAAALANNGCHAERVAVLERRAALPATEAAERAELWLEIGEIQEQQMEDPSAAAQAYRRALEADPERALGHAALEDVLRRTGRLDELADALAPALAATAPARRAALLCRLGAIDLESGDARAAAQRFTRALDCDPNSERARSGLLRAAEANGDDKTILDLHAREAARCDLERLAELGREALRRSANSDDPETALLVVQRWAERAGTREANEALVTLFEESGRTEELVPALEFLETFLDGAERAANRRRLGYLHAAEGRIDDAIAAWREALRHDDADLASLEALAAALAESDRDAELLALCDGCGSDVLLSPHVEGLRATALERAGRVPEAAARFRALHDAGAVDEDTLAGLERTARAIGDLATLEAALAARAARCADPVLRERCSLEHAELLDVQLDRAAEAATAYGALERNAADASIRATARQRLDALLERTRRFEELCERLAARVATSAPPEAARLHERIAEVAESQLGDRARARRHFAEAAARAPERAETWRRLAALCDDEADAAALADALDGELRADPSTERALALHLQIAQLSSDRLDDAARAEQHYRAALAIDAGHGEAHAFVAERLEAAGAWAELATLLRDRLEKNPSASAQMRTLLRLRLARVLAEGAGEPAEAAVVLEAARGEAGTLVPIAEPLADLYARLGRREDESRLCAAAAEACTAGAEAAPWWTRAGDAARASGDETRATGYYQQALALDAGAASARQALIEILRARGEAAALVAVLETDLGHPERDGVALRVELAELEEQLGRADRACGHWTHAAALAPDDLPLRDRALACALGLGRHEEAATLLRAAARDPRCSDRAALWRRCGELFAATRADEAIAAWGESLAVDPAQPELRRRRRMLLEAAGRSEEVLVELLLELESAAPHERAELIAGGADLAIALHGVVAAAPWLARLEAERPDDPDLWIAIARLHRLAGRSDAQQRALAEAARRCGDPATAAALHRECAALLETSPATRGRALAALEAARFQTPDDRDLLAALDRHYTENARWRELLGVLEKRLASARDPERGSLCRRAARCAEQLGEVAAAAGFWRDAVAPGLLAAERRAAILPAAVDAQLRAHRFESFVTLAEEELAGATGTRRISLLRDVARVLRDQLAQPARALVHLRRLADEPGRESCDSEALLTALRSAGAQGELATRLAVRLEAQPGDTVAWRELAELREEALFDAAGAADAWRALAEREPNSRVALAGVRRSAERIGDMAELARALEREIAIGAQDPAGCWRRLARVRLDGLGDVGGAERAFAEARAADPGDLDSLRELARLAEAREDWQTAFARHAEELDALGDTDAARRHALWLRIADRAAGPAGDLPRAADAFERAAEISALPAASLAAWAGVLRELGATARWRAVFAAYCDHPDTKADARDHLVLARALVDAGSFDEAERRLAPVLERESENAAAWALSARVREAAGDAEGATRAWTRAAEASTGLDAARAFRAAAAPWESTDPGRALELLTQASAAFAGFAPAHAALAIVAERLGRHDVAIRAAASAVGGDAVAAPLTLDERLSAARAGTRSGYALARWTSAWELGGEVLALAPDDADAWLARGVAAFHLGSPAASCRALEAWLATEPPEASRPLPLCVLADALAAQNDDAGALIRFTEALAIDSACDPAHAGRSASLERQGQHAAAAHAFAEWADRTPHEIARADRYVRAARLARAAGDASLPVEAWLCAALDAQPAHAQAWLDLTTWLDAAGRNEDAFRAACEGAACVDVPVVTAALEVRRASALEASGDEAAACRAYQRAAQLDAAAAPAALAAARLLRRSGAWSEAATLLGDFAARHGDAGTRAELLAERGRLLAGPLEDVAGALDAYRQSIQLAPERLDQREALGSLLAQLPGSIEEAQSELATVLHAEPLRTSAVRRLADVLRSAGRERDAAHGMALLRALGAVAPGERGAVADTLDFAIGAERLEDATGETMRGAILSVAGDWAEALPSTDLAAGTDPAISHLQRAWDGALRAIAGPALAALAPAAFARGAEALVGTALGIASTLATSDEALDAARGLSGRAARRLRRALGKLDTEALGRFDFDAWTASLRGLALANAVDRCDGDLRAALLCAQQREARPGTPLVPVEVDLVPWLRGSDAAREAVGRAVRAWLRSL